MVACEYCCCGHPDLPIFLLFQKKCVFRIKVLCVHLFSYVLSFSPLSPCSSKQNKTRAQSKHNKNFIKAHSIPPLSHNGGGGGGGGGFFGGKPSRHPITHQAYPKKKKKGFFAKYYNEMQYKTNRVAKTKNKNDKVETNFFRHSSHIKLIQKKGFFKKPPIFFFFLEMCMPAKHIHPLLSLFYSSLFLLLNSFPPRYVLFL